MANRLIGVEITLRTLRVAVLRQSRGTFEIIAVEQKSFDEISAIPGMLADIVPGGFQLSDRVIAALPAGQAYVRTLHFPFKERRKILAAAPFELASQLPVALEECQTVMLTPQELVDGAMVVAAAVPKTAIDRLLQPFEQSRTPLHLLDLMPYALAGGIGGAIGTGVLVCINEEEATLSCLAEGQIVEYRHFPLDGADLTAETAGQLLRETTACRNRMKMKQTPVFLTGALATPQLLELMKTQGLPAELFTMTFGQREIPPAFIPAVALALRAGNKTDDRCFNLRQGSYAYRGEAATLRKSLYCIGGLFAASLLIFALATVLDYRDRRRQAEFLLQQMTQQYRETFPGSQITVDIPLQMQSKLQELHNRAAALGIGSQPQALQILKELSAITERSPYEIEDLSCDQNACSLTGSTDSFDAVNRIREQLGTSALFGKTEVAETRKGLDAGRIEFRLSLTLVAKGVGQ